MLIVNSNVNWVEWRLVNEIWINCWELQKSFSRLDRKLIGGIIVGDSYCLGLEGSIDCLIIIGEFRNFWLLY